MRRNQRQAALVCVTNQYSCERLILAGKNLALSEGLELKVLCVQPPEYASGSYLAEIEYLFAVSRRAGAEMIVYYRDDPVRAAVTFIHANRIIAAPKTSPMLDRITASGWCARTPAAKTTVPPASIAGPSTTKWGPRKRARSFFQRTAVQPTVPTVTRQSSR